MPMRQHAVVVNGEACVAPRLGRIADDELVDARIGHRRNLPAAPTARTRRSELDAIRDGSGHCVENGGDESGLVGTRSSRAVRWPPRAVAQFG